MRKPARPVLVTLLAVVQILVGCSLLCGGAFWLLAPAFGSSSATVTVTANGKSTTRVYDTREEMEREAPGYKTLFLVSSVGGLLLAGTMLLAALGLLLSRAWGWWLSLVWALAEIAYQIATAAYLWLVAMPAANRVAQAVPRDDAGLCGPLVNGNTFYNLVWALFATGFVLYPAFVLLLLTLPPVRRAFRPIPRTDEEREWDEAEEADRRRKRRRHRDDD